MIYLLDSKVLIVMAIILNEIIYLLNFSLKFEKLLCFRYSAVYRPFLHEFNIKQRYLMLFIL